LITITSLVTRNPPALRRAALAGSDKSIFMSVPDPLLFPPGSDPFSHDVKTIGGRIIVAPPIAMLLIRSLLFIFIKFDNHLR